MNKVSDRKFETPLQDLEGTPSPHLIAKHQIKKIPFVGENWAKKIKPTPGVGAAVERLVPFGRSGRHFEAAPGTTIKKTPGIKGKFQRLLPGGKKGYQLHKEADLRQDWEYTKYLAGHKWNLIGPGRQLGVPYSTLLAHDLDKFKPKMFRTYSDWFFGPEGIKGSKSPKAYKAFRKQVDKHYRRSAHHAHKIGKNQPLKNQLEALADWYSVGKTTGSVKEPFKEWYKMKRNTLKLTPEAREIADQKLLKLGFVKQSAKKPKEYYHGSPHQLTHVRRGTYITPYQEDALIFGVPWSSKELANNFSESGRPPKTLVFKGEPPVDHPVYLYKVVGPSKKFPTNTGKVYDWNRVVTKKSKVTLVKTIPSWQEKFLYRVS